MQACKMLTWHEGVGMTPAGIHGVRWHHVLLVEFRPRVSLLLLVHLWLSFELHERAGERSHVSITLEGVKLVVHHAGVSVGQAVLPNDGRARAAWRGSLRWIQERLKGLHRRLRVLPGAGPCWQTVVRILHRVEHMGIIFFVAAVEHSAWSEHVPIGVVDGLTLFLPPARESTPHVIPCGRSQGWRKGAGSGVNAHVRSPFHHADRCHHKDQQ